MSTERAVEQSRASPCASGPPKGATRPHPILPIPVPLSTLNPIARGTGGHRAHGEPVKGWTLS
jgi:hypothetical protein